MATKKNKKEGTMKPLVKKGQDNLRCELTEAELLAYARKQSDALQDINRTEDELKTFQTAIKNKIAGFEAIVNDASEKIRTGYEFRYVNTEITTDYDAELVTFKRLDTGECYAQRTLNADERQLKLEADLSNEANPTQKDKP